MGSLNTKFYTPHMAFYGHVCTSLSIPQMHVSSTCIDETFFEQIGYDIIKFNQQKYILTNILTLISERKHSEAWNTLINESEFSHNISNPNKKASYFNGIIERDNNTWNL